MAQGATALLTAYDQAERIAAEFERVGITDAADANEREWLLAASIAGLSKEDMDGAPGRRLRSRVSGMLKSRQTIAAAGGDVFATLGSQGFGF